ncbi:MAG: hypothetical protein H0W67_00205 [Gemmatimonadales bacterium]|nr:hypothetical protein [Gemmatimonadales bacterium]
MTDRLPVGILAVIALVGGACGGDSAAARRPSMAAELAPATRDAQALGREIFELVDRAVDYRGSHQGRPASSLPQMGVESLTPSTVRRLANVQREPVVTVAFRRIDGREVTACRGDSQILEEATLNAGRFTLMCTSSTGSQHPVQVGEPSN